MKQKKSSFDWYATRQRFSIRKYHIGAASVLLGTALVLGNAATVSADENTPAIVATAEATEVAEASQAPAVDKTALTQAVDASKAIDLANKPAELAESFVEVFTQATDVLNNTEATQEEVDATLAKLNEAVEAIQAAATVEVAPAILGTPVATPDADELAPVAETTEETATEAAEAEAEAEVNHADANSLKVEFLDANNRVLDPNAVFDGGVGTNMQIKVRVTLPENATEKKVEIELGRFLTFNSTGNNDDTVRQMTTHVSSLTTQERNILGEDGKVYTGSTWVNANSTLTDYAYNTKQKVTYTVADTTRSFVIPIVINRNHVTGLRGWSSDGLINGSGAGIEQDTPITVKLSGKENAQVIEQTTTLNRLQAVGVTGTEMHGFYNTVLAGDKAAATTSNNYEVNLGIAFYNSLPTTSASIAFVEKQTIELWVPAGVTYLKMSDDFQERLWKKTGERVQDGGTVLTFETKPDNIAYSSVRFIPTLKVDRNVVTDSQATAKVLSNDIVLRNYDNVPFKNVRPNTLSDSYTFNIIDLTEKDDIAFLMGRAGVVSTQIASYNVKPENPNHYITLGGFPHDVYATTLDEQESREKELRYEFPASPHFEVKGIQLPVLNNNYEISTVRVATKNSPTLREVQLPKTYRVPYDSSSKTIQDTLIDITDLGFSADDVLTELIVPIGTFKPGENYTVVGISKAAQHNVFGKYLSDTTSPAISTLITLRDKDYNEADPNKNWVTGTGTLRTILNSTLEKTQTQILVPATQTIGSAKEGTLLFTVRSGITNGYHANPGVDEVAKLHLVLPTNVPLKDVTIENTAFYGEVVSPSIDLSELVVKTQKVQGDKTIYTFDLSKLTNDGQYIGQVGEAGKHFDHRQLVVRARVENGVSKDTTLSYNDMLLVELADGSLASTLGQSTVRATDTYNLVANDNTLFTNQPTTNVLNLPKAERLDMTTEAKLSTESAYKSANENFRIFDITQDLDLKLNIGNKLETEVGELDLYLPIPKQGQNWGANFQAKAFDFGTILKGITVDQAFTNAFDISYYSVAASKLNGTQLTTQQLATESAQVAYNTDTNLIRIKSKSGAKVPASSNFPITFRLGLQNASSAQDGKLITWNPYYAAVYTNGSSVDKARDINLSVALGKIGFTFFNDANATGTKDGSEAAFTGTAPTYELFDATAKKVDLTGLAEASRGGIVIKGLTSTQTYGVRLTAPAGFRFTTGTKGTGATTTGHAITASLTDVTNTALTNIGLTPVITITDPAKVTVNDIKNVSAAEKVSITDAVKAANANKFPANTRFDVAADGTVTVTYPDGFTQTIPGTKTVQQRATSAAPTINAIDNDDTTISGTGVTGATVTVNIPGQGSRTVPVTNGTWTVTGVTPLATGTNVTVTQTEPSKLVSPVTTKAVVAAPSAKPVINKVDTDDTTITGTGVPGATISVTIPGVATPVTTKVGPNGEWSVPLTKPLTAGQTVTATQTEPNKAATPSDPKTVVATTADGLTPTAKTPHTVPLNSDPVAKDAINTTGLPADTRYEWVTKPDTTTTGPKTGSVRVTFSDGSSKVVPINLTVVDQRKLAEIHEPIGQDVTINAEEAVTPISRIINTNEMPPNTTYEWENGAPDVRIAGTSRIAYVKVKYSDGSHDSVQVRINIRPNMAQRNIPEGYVPTGLRLNQNLTPDAFIKNLASLPANTQFTWAAQPNMATRGAKVGRIRVTYTDGSTEEVIIRFNLR